MNILDSFIEGAQHFSPRNREKIYRAIIEYMYFGFEPDFLKKEALGYFEAIKPSLQKHRSRVESGRIGGKKSVKQTGKQNVSKTVSKRQANTQANVKQNGKQTGKQNVRDNDNDNDNDIKREISKEKNRFEELWKAYPRKVGKQQASKAYDRALKAGASEQEIIDGLERFVAYCKATGRESEYIPHCSTWINQQRWEDDLGNPSTWTSTRSGLLTDMVPDYSEEGW